MIVAYLLVGQHVFNLSQEDHPTSDTDSASCSHLFKRSFIGFSVHFKKC